MAWPTTDDPRDNFVTIRLTASEVADLDKYAKKQGVSRSSAVRAAVEKAVTRKRGK